MLAYLVSFGLSFAMGTFFIHIIKISPETLFQLSTKRVSYVFPILETGVSLGFDRGIIIFIWNAVGSLVTISFLYTAPLFNPVKINQFPSVLRKAFCGTRKMKLLCFLPGCQRIEQESLRRLFVWLMVPWLGMILLGLESGLTVSTSTFLFGSYLVGFVSLLPHGIVEIPTISYAGAVAFTAHILVKEKIKRGIPTRIFENLNSFISEVPLLKVVVIILFFLVIAGLIEAHVTFKVIDSLIAR